MSGGKRDPDRAPGARCAICGGECRGPAVNRHYPFCSQRCQLIDLGRWLDGDYRIPGEPAMPMNDGDGDNGGGLQ